jgi:hypothetical protein
MLEFDKIKLGKLPAAPNPSAPRLANYIKPDAAFPPDNVNWGKSFNGWGKELNDELNTGTIAAALHAIQVWKINMPGGPKLADVDALQLYMKCCGYSIGNSRTDRGGVAFDVLSYWFMNTFGGHKISAFPYVDPRHQLDVKRAIAKTGGLYIGLRLPLAIKNCLKEAAVNAPHDAAAFSFPWEAPKTPLIGDDGPGSWGGQAVYAIAYDGGGIRFIAWGLTWRMTWDFLAAYGDEAYALFNPDWIVALGLDMSEIELDDLENDTFNFVSRHSREEREKALGVHDSSILFSIHIGEMTIDIKYAALAWIASAIGTWLAARTGLDPGSVQTWLGGALATLASFFHFKRIADSNGATAEYKQLVDETIKERKTI